MVCVLTPTTKNTILVRSGVVTAIDADGAKLGTFKTDKEAIPDSWQTPT